MNVFRFHINFGLQYQQIHVLIIKKLWYNVKQRCGYNVCMKEALGMSLLVFLGILLLLIIIVVVAVVSSTMAMVGGVVAEEEDEDE